MQSSTSLAVRTPDDIKGKKPYMWRDDIVQPILYQLIGGVTPVPLNVPEALRQLNTGAVDIVNAPSLAAEQLQWSSKLDTIVEDVSALAIVLDTGKVAANALTRRIRGEDDAAFIRMKGRMTVVTLSAHEKSKWGGLFKQTRALLSQGTFSPELVKRLERLAQ